MSRKKLGVLGGMGPLATAIFYEMIVKNTKADSDQDHIYTIVSSHGSIPDRTKVIMDGEDVNTVLDSVMEDIKLFEYAEVSNIAIPCNTFHYFYDHVQAMTEIPIINMVDEAMKECAEIFGEGSTVGILGTKGTINSGVYDVYAERHNIKLYKVDKFMQDILMKSIYDIKETGRLRQDNVVEIIDDIMGKKLADGIVLACTELSLVELDNAHEAKIVDAMEVLVNRSITRSGYECR